MSLDMIPEKERKNCDELFKLMQENPDLPVVPMVDGNFIGRDEFGFWMGNCGIAKVDEYLIPQLVMKKPSQVSETPGAARPEGQEKYHLQPYYTGLGAELLAQDLQMKTMSITEAEKKIKAFADGRRTCKFACVTPMEADSILREFYGLTEPEAVPAPPPARRGGLIDLPDFL